MRPRLQQNRQQPQRFTAYTVWCSSKEVHSNQISIHYIFQYSCSIVKYCLAYYIYVGQICNRPKYTGYNINPVVGRGQHCHSNQSVAVQPHVQRAVTHCVLTPADHIIFFPCWHTHTHTGVNVVSDQCISKSILNTSLCEFMRISFLTTLMCFHFKII